MIDTLYSCRTCKWMHPSEALEEKCNQIPVTYQVLKPGFVFQLDPKGFEYYKNLRIRIENKDLRIEPPLKQEGGNMYGVITKADTPAFKTHIQQYQFIGVVATYLINKSIKNQKTNLYGLPIIGSVEGLILGNANSLLDVQNHIFDEIKEGLEFGVKSHFASRRIKEELTLTNKR